MRAYGTQGDWLDGGDGADVLVGATTADVLNGGGGADVLVGGGGGDTLLGDAGFAPAGLTWSYADSFATGTRVRSFSGMNGGPVDAAAGAGDMLYGGGGDDFAMAGAGDDAVHGDEGNDFLQGDAGSDALSGGDGVDELVGDGSATAAALHGNDTLDGGAGNDTLTGGGGADHLLGGDGNDSIAGDDDPARLALGSHGDDFIDGGAGRDQIDGDGGNDRINGGADADTLFGSEGDDDIDGGAGDDWLSGGADDDTLEGGAGVDELQGGAGTDALDGGLSADRLWGDAGDDTLTGDDGDDYLDGGDGGDSLDAGGGNDTLLGAAGDDALAGGDGDDQLVGGAGRDAIEGGDGGDQLWGQDDDDRLTGGDSSDVLSGGAGDDRLDGGSGDDALWGDDGDDTLAGGGGRDLLAGGAGNDRYLVNGEAGEVQIADDGGANIVAFGAGIAAGDLRLRDGIDESGNASHLVLELGVGQRVTLLDALADGATGFSFAFEGGATLSLAQLRAQHDAEPPASSLSVAAATVWRGHHGTAGDDRLVAVTGAEQQYGYAGNDTLTGSAGDDALDGGSGNDSLDGRGGNDALRGGPGQDSYAFSRASGRDTIEESVTAPTPVSEADTVALAPGTAPADVTLHRDSADLVVAIGQTQAQLRVKGHFNTTEATLNPLTGKWETWYADRRIEAIRFADGTVWDATAIATRTVAGAPNAMTGTTANDTFTVDDAGDAVTESAGGGSDVIRSSVSYALRPNVERLALTGFVDLSAWANAGNPVSYLDGNAGNNTFNGPGTYLNASGTSVTSAGGGEAGYAVMSGGPGDDTYWLRPDIGGQVVEAPDAGSDTVVLAGASWINYTLPANVENLRSDEGGTSYPAQTRYRTGNALDNTIEGFRRDWMGAGPHNVIDGGAGADTMIGFDGIDVFVVDNVRDRVVDRGSDAAHGLSPAADEIRASVSYVLPEHVEILTLTGADAIDGTGNDLANTLDGVANTAVNTLDGGRGNDRYRAGANDVVVERAGEGIDTLELNGAGTRTYTPEDLPANVEGLAFGDDLGASDYEGDLRDDIVTGNASANRLTGGMGDDTLAGGAGNDTLVGGAGDDLLEGGAGLDEVLLARGFGQDQVTDADSLYRVVFDASIAPADVSLRDGWLSVAGGSDRVHLAEGAELRFADGTVVSRTEFNAQLAASRSSVPTSGADLLTGTDAADTLDALEGDDFLYGRGGNDTLRGGAGDDRVFGDDGADTLNGGAGRDQLRGGAGDDGLDGGDDADVLHGDDGADRLAGGAALDYLYGDAGDDELDGGADGDQLDGGAGSDRLAGGDGDFDYLDGGDGADQLFGDRIDGIGAGDGVDYLTGGAGNDTLTGGGGNDSLDGGAGNDTYVLQSGGGIDVVSDPLAAGETTVVTVDAAIAPADLGLARVVDEWGSTVLQLRANGDADGLDLYDYGDAAHPLEIRFGDGTVWTHAAIQDRLYSRHGTDGDDLLEGGWGDDRLYGYAGTDTLNGYDGNDLLDGGTGVDTLRGGAGDDRYIVDTAADVVVELAGEGWDAVDSPVALTLAANVDALTLTGTAAINGTGNALPNIIVGNAAANALDGKAGADVLRGGAGNDSYVVDNAGDVVTEIAGEGTDTVSSSIAFTLGADLENLTLTGSGAFAGTGNAGANVLKGNAAANTLTGLDGNDTLDGGAGADALRGGNGDDTYTVDNAGDVVTEAAGGGTDLVKASVTATLAANVELLTLTGTGAINGTGNALDNWLQGNAAANTLAGGDGQDLLWGDLGNDLLQGGNGRDLMQGGDGNDTLTDTVGNNFLHGGAGADGLTGGSGAEFFAGGAGNDTLTVGSGADVIGFNRGDGADIVNASTGADNTLSLGKGIRYADVALTRTGNDLVVETGVSEQVTLKDWYLTTANRHVVTLQMVIDASTDYAAGSTDPLRSRRLERFDFAGLVSRYDAARAVTPTLSHWSVASALASVHQGGSDTAAFGGDFAYQYGHAGAFTGIGAGAADAVLAAAAFGASAQALQSSATLFGGARTLR